MFTRGQYHQLQHGHEFGQDGGGFIGVIGASLRKGGPGWIQARVAWDLLGAQIIREWITMEPRPSGHGGPGTRPFMWWLAEAPERRQRIDGLPHPHDDPARQAHVAAIDAQHPGFAARVSRLYFGAPCCSLKGPGFDDFSAEYEAEYEFLDRLGLWLPGELAAGVPLLAADIAKLKAKYASAECEPTTAELDELRRHDANLARFRAKLGATP